MTFDNCTYPEHYIYYDHCGDLCAIRDDNVGYELDTQAARMYAIYDYDGSVSGTNEPTIISTHYNWWSVGDECIYDDYNGSDQGPFLWYCPWNEYESEIGYLRIDIPGLTDGIRDDPFGTAAALIGEAETDYIIGYASQFGRNYSIEYPNYPSIAGP
eukprot:337642_1